MDDMKKMWAMNKHWWCEKKVQYENKMRVILKKCEKKKNVRCEKIVSYEKINKLY
jgi:hypothetical protein